MSQYKLHRLTLLATAVMIFTSSAAHAEPSPSGSHLPLLWALVVLGTIATALAPWIIRRFTKNKMSKRTTWILSLSFAVAFFFCIGQLIIALGSILLTGRTM